MINTKTKELTINDATMVQGEKYMNNHSSSQPSAYKSDDSKRNGFMALQKQKQLDQKSSGSTCNKPSQTSSASNKNVWGPYFKNKDDFVNMHFS